ncbi:hypothetical protein PEPS_32650 (plasmid) [Persicobacter psychrovividus]|uniref:Polysaccharide lyase family 7 protein n=2 Tax=Persicobacter psychrovividus TaxID=387638 RepID=A0ABM7VJ50_9BACT|nr:hypothetical protein PEPS_32650 [Persicobacter psychrovividus]
MQAFAQGITSENSKAVELVNPGFENGLKGWEKSGKVAASDVANAGSKSAKMQDRGASFSQIVSVTPKTNYLLSAYVKGKGTLYVQVGGKTFTAEASNKKAFTKIELPFFNKKAKRVTIGGKFADGQVRFDDFVLVTSEEQVVAKGKEKKDAFTAPRLINAGFENGLKGWDVRGKVSKSDVAQTGAKSAKVDDKGDLSQYVRITPFHAYELSVAVKGKGEVYVRVKGKETVKEFNNKAFEVITIPFEAEKAKSIIIGGRYTNGQGRFDDFKLKATDIEVDPNHQFPTAIIPSLTDWKLTLPVDAEGRTNAKVYDVNSRLKNPLEIVGQGLVDFEYTPYFYAKDGEVFFRGICDGVTTKGSKYPRAELRQQVGGGNNYWSVQDHQFLKTELRVTHLPVEKPEVCMVQIHGPEDEPLRVQYHPKYGVYIVWNEDNKDTQNGVPYQLGENLRITVSVEGGFINCHIENLDQGKEYTKYWKSSDETGYFKVGCYTQSNKFLSQIKSGAKDEPKGAYGEVAVKSIELKETYSKQ